MIGRKHKLPVVRSAKILDGLSMKIIVDGGLFFL
jgi:hypothetical protein